MTNPAKVEKCAAGRSKGNDDIDYFGGVHIVQATLPLMDFAHIVNIGSVAGRCGEYTLAGYTASKFALAGFTEALRWNCSEPGSMSL